MDEKPGATPAPSIACEAIRLLQTLEFDYDGGHRVVEPYCHGVTHKGLETLRAVQVAGLSRSGYGFGKLWALDKMTNVRLTGLTFVPDDPNYNPEDSALARIHCRVERAAGTRTPTG